MALLQVFICGNCSHSVEAWDEGNPYFIDERGKKRYVYHPDPERSRCTGNDVPMLCLRCGTECLSDSADPRMNCPNCNADALTDLWCLDGKQCPYCKRGSFGLDPDAFAIS